MLELPARPHPIATSRRAPAWPSFAPGVVAAFALASGVGFHAGAFAAEPEAPATPAGAQVLSLAQAESLALRHQPAVLQARGQAEAAAGRVEQARSGYLPQVSATGSYQRTSGNFAPRPGALPTSASSNGWNTRTYDYFNLGASASQLIYDFGQVRGRWQAAEVSRDAAETAERSARVQALLAVRRTYFQARAQKDLIAVAAETLRNQQKHLEQIQGFVRAGMRPDIDLAQARTDLANGKLQLVNAENAHALALTALEQAIGTPLDARVQLQDADLPALGDEGGAPETLVTTALKARPEIVAIQQQQQAQELTISSLRGAFGPALGAAAGGTETGTSIDRLVPNFFLGLTLTWPLLQGGLTRGQIREARGTAASLAAQADTVRLQVRVDVRQAQLAITAAKSSISASEEAVTNAREQLRLAERRYETGLGSVIELGDAQVAATGAAAQAIGSRYSLSVARAQLLAALGES